MEKERDVRLVRFDLRLRVGADGDPFDNELHNAWAALPENTVIRNDWLRRRLLLGHILERDGLTELLSAISRIAPPAGQARAQPPVTSPLRQPPLQAASADFLPPEPDPPPMPAAAPKASARQQLGGLLPTISVPKEKKSEKAEQNAPPANAPAQAKAPAQVAAKPALPSAANPDRAAATRASTGPAKETPEKKTNNTAAENGDTTTPPKGKTRPALAGDQG